ncbi:hypothetical protein [Brachybacterium phenoliresistens]|uniref:Uncharacterized protein n=1 Tax=Brachybacterium phenoliresistens TaxID=396014 RepID=Z9JYV3_9MICO|nr:hypothetical protein [Brachybacterium phenoliresistens]EWS82986.1 hypothetical protein BF93_08005 [Brachybacterium phenoliresistens]
MHSSFIVLAGAPLEAADAMSALEYLGLSPDMDPDAGAAPPAVRVVVPRDPARDLAGTCGADADGPRILPSVEKAFRAAGCEIVGAECTAAPLAAVRAALAAGCRSQAVILFSDGAGGAAAADEWAHELEDDLDAAVLHLQPRAVLAAGRHA